MNAFAEARSLKMMPTWSMRWIVMPTAHGGSAADAFERSVSPRTCASRSPSPNSGRVRESARAARPGSHLRRSLFQATAWLRRVGEGPPRRDRNVDVEGADLAAGPPFFEGGLR